MFNDHRSFNLNLLFQPIEVSPYVDKAWAPIEVNPPAPQAAPVAVVSEPVMGTKEH